MTIALLIDSVLLAYVLLIFVRVIISWIRPDPYNPIVQFVYTLTEPVLAPIRNIMPRGMMLDFSPMIVIILISVLRQIVRGLF